MNELNAALKIANISKSFLGVKAVDKAYMEFRKGRITGIIGPNGAGKSTIFNLINGFIRPDTGGIFIEGEEITACSPWFIARKGVARLFQDVRVFRKLTVLENVILGRQSTGEYPPNLIFHKRALKKQEESNLKKAGEWLRYVGLENREKYLAEDLSYGQQKLLALARLLMGENSIFLLDEPTSGINPEMVKTLLGLIKQIAGSGKTVVFIEHNMNVVAEIANWLYFMESGRISAFGLPCEVLENSEVRRIYMGI